MCIRDRGDDQKVGDTITTGADGICDTFASFADDQVIPVGEGQPNAVCVTAGPNGLRDSAAVGNDEVVGETVTTGPDGVCDTLAVDFALESLPLPSIPDLQTFLNATVYDQAVVEWTVTELPPIEVNYDLDLDGELDNNGLEAAPIIAAASAMTAPFDNVVFVADAGDGGILGFAGLGQKFAFVHVLSHAGTGAKVNTTVAHELGHAFAALEHTDDDDENLMHPDNVDVFRLRRPQWDQIHAMVP